MTFASVPESMVQKINLWIAPFIPFICCLLTHSVLPWYLLFIKQAMALDHEMWLLLELPLLCMWHLCSAWAKQKCVFSDDSSKLLSKPPPPPIHMPTGTHLCQKSLHHPPSRTKSYQKKSKENYMSVYHDYGSNFYTSALLRWCLYLLAV